MLHIHSAFASGRWFVAGILASPLVLAAFVVCACCSVLLSLPVLFVPHCRPASLGLLVLFVTLAVLCHRDCLACLCHWLCCGY